MKYEKSGVVKELKEITVVEDGYRYYNVSEEMAIADGWVAVEVSKDDQYRQRIVELIHERYSVDDEIAILRQRDSKPEEFAEYNSYVEMCKSTARNEVYNEPAS